MNFPNLKTKLTYKKIIPLSIIDFNNNKSVFETLDKKTFYNILPITILIIF